MTGCSSYKSGVFGQRDPAGSYPYLEADEPWTYERVAQVIDPDVRCVKTASTQNDNGNSNNGLVCLSQVLRNFPTASTRERRNAIQEYFLSVSEKRCDDFKIALREYKTNGDFLFGSVSTIAGGAGALINGGTLSRVFSGISSVASGERAEYDQAFFSNLAVEVITDAIDQDRRGIYQQIVKEGQSKSLADYPLEAALKDAVIYHNHCTIATGLQQASKSIKYYDEPGLDKVTQVLAKINLANNVSINRLQTVPKPVSSGGASDASTTTLTAGTYNDGTASTATSALLGALKAVDSETLSIANRADVANKDKADIFTTERIASIKGQTGKEALKFKNALSAGCLAKANGQDTAVSTAKVAAQTADGGAASSNLLTAQAAQGLVQNQISMFLAAYINSVEQAWANAGALKKLDGTATTDPSEAFINSDWMLIETTPSKINCN